MAPRMTDHATTRRPAMARFARTRLSCDLHELLAADAAQRRLTHSTQIRANLEQHDTGRAPAKAPPTGP
jgi:hypothetical protein